MIIMKKALPRRTFLKGMQAALALPLLDAMIPAATAWAQTPAKPVRRLGFVFVPMGCDHARWMPPRQGHARRAVAHPRAARSGQGPADGRHQPPAEKSYPGTHDTSNAGFLSAAFAKHTESSDYYLGTTVDQVAAKQMGKDTQLPSLELSMDLNSLAGVCNNGYACVYQNCLSWSSPTTPLPSEAHPRLVFERLFGEGGPASARRAALQRAGQPARFVQRGYRAPQAASGDLRPRSRRSIPGQRSRGRASDPARRSRSGGQSGARSGPARGCPGGVSPTTRSSCSTCRSSRFRRTSHG